MASATLSGRSGPGLRVGDVLSRAFPVWGRLIGPLSLLYAIQVLPTIVQSASLQTPQAGIQGGAAHAGAASVFGWPLLAASLLSLLIALVTHGATYVAATRVTEGTPPSVMTAIELAMRRFLPLLGTWICGGFLMVVGFILLVVPGIMAYLALFVIGPVCVLEGLGPVPSLKRSAELTKGSRWRLFGLLVVLGVLSGLTNAITVPAKLLFGPLPGALVQMVLLVVIGLFSTIVCTIAYRDLVESHDGFGGGRIASVFD